MFALLSTALISHEELRFAPVFKQGFDTSCGVSAAASLLDRYWNIPVIEADMYQAMIGDRLDDNGLTYTINFLTIQDYLKQQNIQSKAYRMDWNALDDTLEKGFAPILINYAKPRAHFALLLHIEQGFAFVADPAKGIELVEHRRFISNYSENALLAASGTQQKNQEYLAQTVTGEQRRLNRLRRLALLQGRRR
jgi:predicted double-glycine peptidase